MAIEVLETFKRAHKFGAVRTTIDGISFASKAEAQRYAELTLLAKAGVITGLTMQPKFPLAAHHRDRGASMIGLYIADFAYVRDGDMVIEDVKGMRTSIYNWKKKHFEWQYGIRITEIGRPRKSKRLKRAAIRGR